MGSYRRVALVTGAAKRVGAAIAEQLCRDGYRVMIHYRTSAPEAEALAGQLNAADPDSAAVACADLDDALAIEQLAEAAAGRWGRLDLLVNNASAYRRTPFGSISAANIDELTLSNLRAPLLLTQACAPRLADGGSVVNILDVYARKPVSGYAPYLAAKAGLWTLTEALALELAPRLRVNGVAPGHMVWASDEQIPPEMKAAELARIPLGRLGGAQEIACAVAFLASPQASYISGAVLPVDGGLRLN